MEPWLKRDVDDKDDGNEEVAGVVDGIVPEAGLELAHKCKLPGLGEALHEGEQEPGEQL